ncbi:electron transport complex subunit RsxD [Actinobacillus sp. GY-402]|nr:electron transport complex subunit RsxD [Actinobacillus sp. GY-402]
MFKLTSSPHIHSGKFTARIMLWVIFAMLPALAAQIYYFGFGVLIQICLAVTLALALEFAVTKLRQKPSLFYVSDFSAILTAMILAMAIPPYAPYWVILIGTFCALLLGKHVYGGLGQNLFNPAMVGYVVLLISFPLQMTGWMPPISLLHEPPTLSDSVGLIFAGVTDDGFSLSQLVSSIDGITSATPLDSAKTWFKLNGSAADLRNQPIFLASLDAGLGWMQINLAFLIGGLFLIWKKIIHWQTPLAMLLTISIFCGIFDLFGGTHSISFFSQLVSGAMMFGAFFIATDPVTAPVTPKGKWVFGALIGLLVCLIRQFGNYPDGVAFAVLLANICVPLIDQYTRPRVTGYGLSKGN